MEQDKKSPFFVGVTEAIDKYAQERTPEDSILMVLSDGQTACQIVGGKTEDIEKTLFNYMKNNPSVAEIICRTALKFNFMVAQSVLRVKTPPVPPDGVAEEWLKYARQTPISICPKNEKHYENENS